MKKFVPLLITLFIFYLPLSISFAGNNNLQTNSYHFSGYSKRDGLSNNQVSDIFQDSHGFLWITTYEGLNRFDGVHFINFHSSEATDKNIIPSFINTISEDNKENLWLGTSAGVAKIALKDYQVTLYPLGNNTDIFVHDLLIDEQQIIWAATSAGLYRFSESAQAFTKVEFSNPTLVDINNIVKITTDVQGNIWFIDDLEGSFKLNRDTMEVYKLNDIYSQATLLTGLSAMYFIDDKLWLGSYSGEVEVLNITTNIVQSLDLPFDINEHLIGATIKSFADDQQGNIWIATMGKGLYVVNTEGKEIEHFYHDINLDFSLKDNFIWAIYRDNEQRMWLGTDGAGILFYDKESHLFNHYFPDVNNPVSIRDKLVWSIFEDSQEKLWVGGNKGIDVLNNKRKKEFSLQHSLKDSNSLTDERVFNITEDTKGYMWMSTEGGLNRYDRKNKINKSYYHDVDNSNSLPSNNITNLFIDSTDTLWIGTSRGSVQYLSSKDEFLRIDKLINYEIYNMVETAPQEYWLATKEQGLIHYDKDKDIITKYMHEAENANSLSNNKITGIIQDENYLWVSTQSGLNRININTLVFERYSTKEGLPSNVVYQVRRDKQGFLWGSTSNGLFRLNSLTNQIITFGLNYGLQALDFTSTSGFVSNNNELFFGGVEGFNSFTPNDNFLPKQPLAPVVTELRILNEIITPIDSPLLEKLIYLTDTLTLDYQQNLFSLAFNSVELTRASNLEYQYKLLGFNEQWLSPLPGRPQATFTNLNSGQYQFLTRVRKDHEPWVESARVLDIVITPPPWATWWAFSVYLLISLFIIASIYWQYYQRNLQRVTYLENLEKQKKQLDLVLWGSGDELWDWNISEEQIKRMNCLDRTIHQKYSSHFNVQSLSEFIHPKDIDRVQSTLVRHLNGELDFYEESYRLKTLTNDWIWVLDRGQIVEKDECNKPLRCAGTTKNIDKLKTVEEALIQLTDQLEDRVNIRTQELQNSNKSLIKTLKTLKLTQQQLVESEKMAMLGNLVVGVSHEINTPLGTSITALSVLQEKATQLFEMKKNNDLTKSFFNKFELICHKSLGILTTNLNRTSNLVQNFKQIAVDQSNENKKIINIKSLLQECTITTTSKFSEQEFELQINCEDDIIMDCYSIVLSQVINQLVDNSFDHYSQNACLNINIQVNNLNDTIEIVYKDSGNGITEETYKHMFEPFNTTKRGEGNTGLGMHIVYNQVTQKLGGKIEYISSDEGGAEFNITLPKLSPNK